MSGREKAPAARFHTPTPAESCLRRSAHQEAPSQTVNLEAQHRLERLLEDALATRQGVLERFEAQRVERAA